MSSFLIQIECQVVLLLIMVRDFPHENIFNIFGLENFDMFCAAGGRAWRQVMILLH